MTDEELIARARLAQRYERTLFGDLATRIEELIAERTKDHANINLKADFIDKTINQLAEAQAKLAKAVKLIDLAVELARWDRAPKLRDDMIDFTTEIKGENHE